MILQIKESRSIKRFNCQNFEDFQFCDLILTRSCIHNFKSRFRLNEDTEIAFKSQNKNNPMKAQIYNFSI